MSEHRTKENRSRWMWLCRIGFHRWRSLGSGPLMITEDMQCKRCGCYGFRYNG